MKTIIIFVAVVMAFVITIAAVPTHAQSASITTTTSGTSLFAPPNQPPQVKIVSPANNSHIAQNASVLIKAIVNDPNGIKSVIAQITYPNNAIKNFTMQKAGRSDNWSVNFTDSGQIGKYIARIIATDKKNAVNNTEKVFFFTDDTIPPVVTFISPTPPNNTISSQAFQVIAVSHTETNPNKLRLFVDSILQQEKSYSGSSSSFNVTFSEGTHSYFVQATDQSNNSGSTQTRIITIDTIAPSTTDNAPSTWQQSSVTVTLTCTDSGSGCNQTLYCIDSSNTCIPSISGTSVPVSSEGITYVRYASNDKAGNQESTKSATVQIDTSAPSTTDNAPSGWSASSVTVTLTCTDATSGCNQTLYCVDQGNSCVPSISGTVALVSSEGVNYVRYASTDVAGNTESVKSATVQIDLTNPTTTNDAPSGWVASTVTVTLSCIDNLSGCQQTLYCTDTTNSCTPTTAGTSVPVSAEGLSYVRYASSDVAGNQESVQSASVQIDLSAPVTSDDAPLGWTQGPVTVTLSCADTYSGCAGTFYCIDQSNNCTPSLSGLVVPISTEGQNYLRVSSVDAVGNTETTRSISVQIDDTAPSTSSDAPSGWVAPLTVTLTCSDSLSGCQDTLYCVDQTGVCNPDTSGTSVPVSIEGTNYVRFASTDGAGNQESVQSATVYIDSVAPSTTDDAPAGWSNTPVTVVLTCTDADSGCNLTLYCVDQTGSCTPSLVGTSILVSDEGTNSIRYQSTDVAGNIESIRSATVQIDSTAPTTSHSETGTLGTNGIYVSTVDVSLSCADADSGCSTTIYCLDDATNDCTPSTPYSSTFTLNTEGTTFVRFSSSDVANNSEVTQSFSVAIDLTTPTLTAVSPLNQSYTFLDTQADLDYFLSASEMLASATYAVDGNAPSSLTYNSGTDQWESATGAHPSLSRGVHAILLEGTDLAGHSSQESVTFTIVKEATALDCDDASGKLNGDWDKVTLTQSVDNHPGNCIVFGADGVIFDGGGLSISGDNNLVWPNDYGISVNGKSNIVIENVDVQKFTAGIYDDQGGSYVTIKDSLIHDNTDTGIILNGNYQTISNNDVKFNGYEGISPVNAKFATISNNRIISNGVVFTGSGLHIFNVFDSFITNNEIDTNSLYGILSEGGSGNSVYNNNFVLNNDGINQAFETGINSWDDGSVGNYWDNYDTDAEGCFDTDTNNVCDAPLSLNGFSDYYPMQSPF